MKKTFLPLELKNIWLEHKNELYCVPDLIDITFPWDTVNLILKASTYLKDEAFASINLSASSQLVSFRYDDNKDYVKIDGSSITVGRDWLIVTIWTSYDGIELTTMNIPISALLEGMYCLRVEEGKVIQPSKEDRSCFVSDEWSYVVAPTLETAAARCTHTV